MASSTKKPKSNSRAEIPEAQVGVRTPDDIWQRNPEVIKRFLQVRRDYEQLCTEVEYMLR